MDRNAAAEIGSVEKLASILAKRTRILKDLVEQHLDLYLSLKNQNILVETYNSESNNVI
ncbi:Adenine-specific methyltransferase (plasmid) [Borrelia nietonii YOR]|uniref:Adenine-specific methyltransferase n=2 Tax=Borrelia nietonii YOR TaxID=1293576 RepID=W5SBE7_9SPIR|nr:hypothetical protein [Borrelia nietonii]AHH04265.1 Adenine-specific methyltransferase [Borrelia nietonii YOR]UPA10009.1 hypothetical protein bhYOR_001345 [Borrelia nietonii YOR]